MANRFRRTFRIFTLLLPLILVLALSCDQDSIFAFISVEQEPKDPRMPGTPTNIIEISGTIYAASSGSKTLHQYAGGWSTSAPGGKIINLATDGTDLYALIGDPMNAVVSKYTGSGWTSIGSGDASTYSLQTIYGAGGNIFVGGKDSGNNWKVFYTDGTAALAAISGPPVDRDSRLSGVAADGSSIFYIATYGNGIYTTDLIAPATATPVPTDPGTHNRITGIINVDSTVADGSTITAVTSDGYVLTYDYIATQFKERSPGGSKYTGGMAIWTNGAGDKLLLLGVEGTGSYGKGYREVELDSSTKKPIGGANVPGTYALSTVSQSDKKKYEASIARYSVFYIHQVSWEPSVVFASTAINGLRSLRGGLWNAEE